MQIIIKNTIGLGQPRPPTQSPVDIVNELEYAHKLGAAGISVHSELFSGYITSLAEAEECRRLHEA
jgi:hypothetical protein